MLSLIIKWFRRHHPGRRHSLSVLDQDFVDSLLKHDYTLSGEAMEPMNLIFVGSRLSLDQTFRKAGWHKADRLTFYSLTRAFLAVLLDLPYRHAPFTPLFFNNRTQDFSLQKATKHNTARRRHHIRIWSAGRELPDGRLVWVGSASYDNGVKLIPRPLFLTHKVDVDIDRERDLVCGELVAAGARKGSKFVMLTRAQGKNAFGDRFTTDGLVQVVELPS